VFDKVRSALPGAVWDSSVAHGILGLVAEPVNVSAIAQVLKEHLGFDLFLDVTAVDWPDRDPRFDVVWHFYSTREFVRVMLKNSVWTEAMIVTVWTRSS